MSRFARVLAVCSLTAILVAGCAKERPPRSYVQPNILAKADLTGQWYYVPTVIDINMGHSVTFVGEAGWSVSIIKWDIQENVLYARLAYDRIDNTSSVYNDPNFKGEVVGAWAIQKQFDIIRDYNSTTGEETNTIRETTERPWYEREFIRVNWAENMVSNWEGLMWQRAVTTDPINYIITDPDHPHAPRMERNEEGEAEFINIVNKALVTPEMREIPYDFLGLREIPDCFFYGTLSSCTSTEVTVRHAFWKKDPDHEYEKLEYTQKDMDDYAFFTTQRLYYDDDYGVTIQGMRWYANRFNLWKQSFNKCTTEQEANLYRAQCEVPTDENGDPIEGAEVFSCPGDGEPCRCLVDNKKMYILSEKAYKYSDLDKATPEEAADFAPAQCAGGAYTCSGNECTCDDNGKPVYKLAYRAANLPQELLGRDGVVCPCDDPNSSKWDCDAEEEYTPTPTCFHKVDGTEVHYATPQGKLRYPLRYYERELRVIPYYINKDMPEDIRQQSFSVLSQWAEVFDNFVWRISGCEAAGLVRGQDYCSARPEFDPNGNPFHTFILCANNPVQEGDQEACGPVGREVVPGDIRYNYIHWWRPPQQSSPLGYGPPLADPLTGETISAISNIYGAAMTSYATYARDLVRMMTDKDFQWIDYLHGYYQAAFVRKMQHKLGMRESYKSLAPERKRSWEKKRWSPDDVRALYDNMDMGWTHAIRSHVKPDFSSPEGIRRFMSAQSKIIKDSGVFGNGTRPDRARMNLLRNSYIEDMMMSNKMLLNRAPTLISAGYDPEQIAMMNGADLGYGTKLRSKVSPLNWLNVNYIRAINKIKFSHFANTHMYAEMVPFEEPSTIGMATEVVQNKCGCNLDDNPEGCASVDMTLTERWANDPLCGEKIKQDLRLRIYDPVAVHEMGHNMGLRHNFKGSFDAMNYADEYWDIRVEAAKQAGEPILERYQQPRTKWENMQKVTDYQWASVMDYGAKFNSDFNGFGKWDIAAINYGYGKIIQVFDEVNPNISDAQSTLATIQNFRQFSWPTPIQFFQSGPAAILSNRLHYDPENPTVTPEGVVNTDDSNRMWRPKAWIVPLGLGGTTPAMATNNALEDDSRARIMVPFKMCSDEFRNTSLGCNYFDEGSDIFEITENQIQAYENYYVLNNWGRDRYTWGWNEDSYTGRIWGRYFAIVQNHMQYFGLYRAIFENDYFENIPGTIDEFFQTDWAHFTVAVARGFELFSRVLNTPAPGYYGCGTDAINREAPDGVPYWKMDLEVSWCEEEGGCVGDPNFGLCAMSVDILDGKYWDDTWDFEMGYQWYFKRLRYGQFYDRPLAIQALAEATNNFMGRDTQEDFRLYTINYARIYPDQLLELMGAIQSSDLTVAAPRICEDVDGVMHVEHVNFARMDQAPCEALSDVMGETLTFTGTYLDPGHTFTTQLYGAVFGMTMFPMTYSQEFIDAWRVYVEGSMEGHDFSHCADLAADGCETTTFVDPLSQKTFLAVRYPARERNGKTYDISIGARIIEYANILKQNYEDAVTNCGGLPCEPSNPGYDEFFRRKQQLQDYVMNLEMTRSLTYTFEHPEYSGGAATGEY